MTRVHNILAATDLSDEAAVVTEIAAILARQTGADLVLLHAGWTPDAIERLERDADADELVALAKETLEQDRAKLGEIEETMVFKHRLNPVFITRDGYADQAILSAAAELGSELIVVGTHGRAGVSRFLMGSVAERVVRLAECTVLVARPLRDGARGFERVLVPVDFSEHTDPAIEAAMELMADGGHIDLFHAVELPGAWAADSTWRLSAARKRMLEEARGRGQKLAAEHRKRSARISFDLVDESPAAAIVQRLEAGEYDLCVVGSHGYRGLKRVLLGSVAARTVRHAPCSVAVARRRG